MPTKVRALWAHSLSLTHSPGPPGKGRGAGLPPVASMYIRVASMNTRGVLSPWGWPYSGNGGSQMRRLALLVLAPGAVGALILLAISPAGASHSRPMHTCVTNLGTHWTKVSATRSERVTVTPRACHARIRVSLLGTHWTKSSVTRTERVTLLVPVRPGGPLRQEGECTLNEEIFYKPTKNELTGRDWTDNCTAPPDPYPVQCHQTAQMDWKTPGGSFIVIKTGSSTYGCVEADYAWVNTHCTPSTDNTYEDVGTFTIIWDTGDVFGPKSYSSPSFTTAHHCE